MRKRGYIPAVTETWLTFPERKNGIPTGKMVRIKRDLWNIADLIAYDPLTDTVILVQTTTTAHQADRIAKIHGIPEARQWLHSRSRRIEVHGWMKSKKSGRWEVTATEIAEEDCAPLPSGTAELLQAMLPTSVGPALEIVNVKVPDVW